MKMDQLPFEILLDIFKYLTRCKEIVLVNRRFYNAACIVHDPNIYLTIDYSLLDSQWIPSILDSTRQISRLNIYSLGTNETELRTAISIITKFSVSIKYLKFRMLGLLNMSDFVDILSVVPNLEHLVCDNLHLRTDGQPTVGEILTNIDELNLGMLKKLRCRWCFNEFSAVFDRLPVGTLTDLHDFDFTSIITLLKRQTSIRKLKLTACDFTNSTTDFLDNLSLETLDLWYRPENYFDLATILSNQTKLRSLKLRLGEVDKNFLDLVTNQFTELKTLSLSGPFITTTNMSVAQIFRLKKLENVSLLFNFTDEVGLVESLSSSESICSKITALTIGYGIYEPDIIQAFAKSMPNLKMLKIEFCLYSSEFDDFMRNFNFLEVFQIDKIADVPFDDTDGEYFNPKLEELTVNGSFHNASAFLHELINSYPNLKRLEMKWRSITAWQFFEILQGFTKLESLTLDGAIGSRITKHFFKHIKCHYKNLKFLEVNGKMRYKMIS